MVKQRTEWPNQTDRDLCCCLELNDRHTQHEQDLCFLPFRDFQVEIFERLKFKRPGQRQSKLPVRNFEFHLSFQRLQISKVANSNAFVRTQHDPNAIRPL